MAAFVAQPPIKANNEEENMQFLSTELNLMAH